MGEERTGKEGCGAPWVSVRLSLFLLSFAVIGLELALMRALAMRFWHHFAYMVVAVALLGFGASGTVVSLLRGAAARHFLAWSSACGGLFAMSIPATVWAARLVPANVQFLAWDPFRQAGHILLVELLAFVPFFFAGMAVCAALMDRPDRIPGHYAANLAGSGAGAVGTALLMNALGTGDLIGVMALVGLAACLAAVPRRSGRALGFGGAASVGTIALVALLPLEPVFSEYKTLPSVLRMPDARVLLTDEGPMGRLDVVACPSLHYSPGVGLQYQEALPPHVLMIHDGDGASAVYEWRMPDDFAFLDHTTAAAAYRIASQRDDAGGRSALMIGAGGGADIGLARMRGCARVVALEVNPRVIAAMSGLLRERGGNIYAAPGVQVVRQEARGFLSRTGERFDVIQLPPLDALGAAGSGMYAAQESYLYTVEAFEAMLRRLAPGGVLCVTRWARTPPRDGLRVLDTAAQALRRAGLDPAQCLALVRNWATVSVLVRAGPLDASACAAIRSFCEEKGFDLGHLPGMAREEANRFHVLDRPYYFDGAAALLGPDRERFLREYLFDVSAPTDDRPYFHQSFRWKALGILRRQVGGRTPAFLELGYLLLVAAAAQCGALAVLLVVLPLVPGVRALRGVGGKAAVFGYFAAIGLGFMLLEMGFLQKMVLYLAHPTYAASAVIAAFLVFGGAGSMVCRRWGRPIERLGPLVAAAAAAMGLACLALLDGWLGLTISWPTWARFGVAALTAAPPAFAMGHLFPLGLSRLGEAAPALTPWAWAVNGCASVIATVGAPLLAMRFGFRAVGGAAAVCYAAASLLARRFPRGGRAPGTEGSG